MAKILDCDLEMSSNSTPAIMFTFGLIPFRKGKNPLIPKLWVE